MENKFAKKIYGIILALFISFWCVIAVGGITAYHVVQEVQRSQVQLEKVTEVVEYIDTDTLNNAIKTLNKAVKPLKELLGK